MKLARKIHLETLIILLMNTHCWAESIQLGSIQFLAKTNVKMFRFTGEVKDLSSTVVRSNGKLSSLELRIPVKSIKTGMDIRDKHMQERIFTAADGSLPDIVYRASKAECHPGASAPRQNCAVSGKLTIRGETKDYPLTVVLDNGLELTGTTTIDVFQFGVKPELLQYSEIKCDNQVELDFKVKIQ